MCTTKSFLFRMAAVLDTLSVQNTEAETEAAKFGEDVKYLAGKKNSLVVRAKEPVLYVRGNRFLI
jgi:hypothetical protein